MQIIFFTNYDTKDHCNVLMQERPCQALSIQQKCMLQHAILWSFGRGTGNECGCLLGTLYWFIIMVGFSRFTTQDFHVICFASYPNLRAKSLRRAAVDCLVPIKEIHPWLGAAGGPCIKVAHRHTIRREYPVAVELVALSTEICNGYILQLQTL